MTHLLLATSVITAATIELAVPLVVAVQLSGAEWTPTSISGSLVVIIGAVVLGTTQIIGALSAAEDRRQAKLDRERAAASAVAAEKRAEEVARVQEVAAAAAARKADVIVEKTTEIHTAANSTLAAAVAALALARMEFKGLKESTDKEIEGLKKQIALLIEARTAAVAATTPATVPPTETK